MVGLLFKLLDGDGRGKLNDFTPTVVELAPARKGRHTVTGLQLVDQTDANSLLGYKRCIVGRAPKVWKKLPQDVLRDGKENGLQNITKECQRFLTGKKSKSQKNRTKQTKQTKQNDQSEKFYTLAEKIGFKQSGLLPLGFNEHTQILRFETLSNFSFLNRSIN